LKWDLTEFTRTNPHLTGSCLVAEISDIPIFLYLMKSLNNLSSCSLEIFWENKLILPAKK
jgi:hypothetical protein